MSLDLLFYVGFAPLLTHELDAIHRQNEFTSFYSKSIISLTAIAGLLHLMLLLWLQNS